MTVSKRRLAELEELVVSLRASLAVAQSQHERAQRTAAEQEHTIAQQRSEIMRLQARLASRRNVRLRQQAQERQRG